MPNYYEVLKVATDANPAEIEAAYDAQYNHWRRLVTHHDPKIVHRANQALRWLEQIRTTLLDDELRTAYDARLGLTPGISGLADPQAQLSKRQQIDTPRDGNAPRPAWPLSAAWSAPLRRQLDGPLYGPV